MKEKFLKIKEKDEFFKMLSLKLKIKKETIRPYIYSNRVPEKSINKIKEAINLQLEFEKKIKEYRKEMFKNL